MDHVHGIIDGLAVATVLGLVRWGLQLRKDIDAAFEKIRELQRNPDHSTKVK